MHLRCVLAVHHPQQRVTSGSSGQPMKIRGKTISSQLPLEYDRFWCCTAAAAAGIVAVIAVREKAVQEVLYKR